MQRIAVCLLDADPDLAEDLPEDVRRRLADLLRVRVLAAEKGCWEPPAIDRGSFGLLVLGGMMIRRVRLGPVWSSELVGPGDILRPSEQGLLPDVVSHSSAWNVLEDCEVAVIDRRATALLGSFPELSGAIGARMLRRTRGLAYLMAAQHFRRIDEALLATLWHIAGMWGKVAVGGVVVPFNFTHATLAEIIGARRPSVTLAVRKLRAQGLLRRDEEGRWLLLGEPPQWDPEGITQGDWTDAPLALTSSS